MTDLQFYFYKWPVGAHTAFAGRICDTIWTGINYGMYALQFFMGSSRSFNRTVITENDINECKKILARFPTKIFSHFPYVANLAGSKDFLAWNGDSSQDGKTTHLLKMLEYELHVLGQLNGGVVIHPGNHTNEEKGLKAIATSINKIKFTGESKLLLENSAGQGTSLATTFEQIKTIIDNVEKEKRKHIGVCIDTCHIFSYGQYDLSQIDVVEKMFTNFDKIIGLDRFTLLHLNDSETSLGKKVDRHAYIGTGYIWGNNFDSLVYLLNKCEKLNIPVVLETRGRDMLVLGSISTNLG